MADLKKIAAVTVSAILAGTMLTSCSDTTYSASYGDEKVNAGIYIYSMFEAFNEQYSSYYYSNLYASQGADTSSTTAFMDTKVEDKTMTDYLETTAKDKLNDYCAIVEQFNKLGLKLDPQDISDINDAINEQWESYGDMYESFGISKDSVKLVTKASQMKSDMFDYYYDRGGEKEVSDDDMLKYIDENYLRYKAVTIPKSTSEDETTKTSEDKENEELRDKYLEEAKTLSFDEFDKVIDEYTEYTNEQAAAAASSSSEAATDSVAQAVSDDSSTESSSSEDSTSTESEAEADSSSEAEIDVTSSDEGLSIDTTAADPYANETFTNYGKLEDDDKDTDNGKLLTEVNGLEENVATAYEDDTNYYVVMKGSVSERAPEYIAPVEDTESSSSEAASTDTAAVDNHKTVLYQMKTDEFEDLVDGWAKDLDVKVNNDAIKRYTPAVLYEKFAKYTSSSN